MNQIQAEKIAYIQASWHKDIVRQSYCGFIAELGNQGIDVDNQIDKFDVPGSLEIPLQALRLAKTGKYSIVVCAGLIVDGGIYKHEFVAQSVLDGMMRVQLDTEVPVLSIVLTPHQFQETDEHQRFFSNHFFGKGSEAARACVETLKNSMEFLNTETAA